MQQAIEVWPVSRLVPYARNPRQNDGAVDRMCSSIREFGFNIPCLVRSNGDVVDGHLRLKAAVKLGIAEIPVILCDEWTPAQVKAFRIMVNRSVTWADWDEDLLTLELQELQALEFDLDLTGFDTREIDTLLRMANDERADDIPPLPAQAVSQVGDVWLLGNHRVLCGDATDGACVASLLCDRKPQLMVTDPPYGVEYDPAWRARAGVNQNREKLGQVSNDHRADWREAWALFPGDVLYVWHAGRFSSVVQESIESCGFEIRAQIIWAKDRFALSRGHYHWQHEPCWYAVRSTAHWNGDRSQSTLWHTTLVAAELTDRVCYGMELDPKYVDVVIQRWQTLSGQEAVLDGANKTFGQVAKKRTKGAA